ncbi:hypothetical protein [Gemmata sp. SH-PL17]|uniref:hypothetical protein n=1 Tax=Gemmata sp. SH-PL17 TaxID=1630693 RepID=UPI0004B3FCF3|nr:hypothetical protein [Gemmata sp. SH-PL17]
MPTGIVLPSDLYRVVIQAVNLAVGRYQKGATHISVHGQRDQLADNSIEQIVVARGRL